MKDKGRTQYMNQYFDFEETFTIEFCFTSDLNTTKIPLL